MDTVAVVIVVFNRRLFLEKALLSLKSQSREIDELIISDDGSDEDIKGLVEEFAGTVPYPVRYVYQQNRGFRLAKCRNNAIRAAQSDFLIFIDQDVVYTRDYLKTFIEHRRAGRLLVAYPVRLTEEQTSRLTDEMIAGGDYTSLITGKQRNKIRRQFVKDGFDRWLGRIIGKGHAKPKLRGGVCGMYKADLLTVDGYDENYRGWGNEDDDLGRRLYRAGIRGMNPFLREFPIHLWHEPFHLDGERVNRSYYRDRKAQITRGDFRAVRGISNPEPDDSIKVVTFG